MDSDILPILRDWGTRDLKSRTVETLLRDAADEIERLRFLVSELLPFMVNDIENGVKMGPAPLGHVDDCQDCLWYESSQKWMSRINKGEFDEFSIRLTG